MLTKLSDWSLGPSLSAAAGGCLFRSLKMYDEEIQINTRKPQQAEVQKAIAVCNSLKQMGCICHRIIESGWKRP